MLSLDDLIAAARKDLTEQNIEGGRSIDDTKYKSNLEKLSQISSSIQPFQTPQPKCKIDKLKSKAAYQQVSKDLSKWVPAIALNRKAETLSLNVLHPTTSSSLKPNSKASILSFTPKTPLEHEMSQILTQSDNNTKEEFPVSTPDAFHQRQVELQKLRSFLFFQQQRNKRISKIKSKAYHRFKKKEKAHTQDLSSPKELFKAEIARAKERMTLRHKKTKNLQPSDPQSIEARLAIEDQERIQKLKAKIYLPEELTTSFNEEVIPETQSDTDSDHSGNTAFDHNEDNNKEEDSEFHEEEADIHLGKRSFNASFPKDDATCSSVLLKENNSLQFQKELVAEAFEKDVGVVEMSEETNFADEKKQTILQDMPKPLVDVTLPGWGFWGGFGLPASKSKLKRPHLVPNPNLEERTGVTPQNRQDSHLPHVIIREKKDSKLLEKYQIDKLPYPFEDEFQFNAANYLVSIGKEWTPVSLLKKKISPRINQNLHGTIIRPISHKRKER